MLAILLTLIVLAILLWGGDALLALVPGNEKIKRAVRVIVTVCVALYLLSLIAAFFGLGTPLWPMLERRHR